MSGHLGSLSVKQKETLEKIRETLDTTLTGKFLEIRQSFMDDAIILRFLRARQFDYDKSLEMIMNMLKFRAEFQNISVAGVNPANCDNELKTGKSYFYKTDKLDRPVTYIRARLHFSDQCDPLENQRFTILQMEYGKSLMPPPCETATIVFDMTGTAMKNIDMASVKFMVNTLANFYPETLGQVLVYDAPWIINGAWKVIKPWLDPVTAAKVIFIKSGTLPEYIALENLPSEYGGQDSYKYDYESYKAKVEAVVPSPSKETPK